MHGARAASLARAHGRWWTTAAPFSTSTAAAIGTADVAGPRKPPALRENAWRYGGGGRARFFSSDGGDNDDDSTQGLYESDFFRFADYATVSTGLRKNGGAKHRNRQPDAACADVKTTPIGHKPLPQDMGVDLRVLDDEDLTASFTPQQHHHQHPGHPYS